MMYLDLAMRGGGVTLLALLAVLLWFAPISREGRLSMSAVALTQSALLVAKATLPFGLNSVILSGLLLISSLTPAAITWLIVTIFLDAPGRRWPWMVVSFTASAAFYVHLVDSSGSWLCFPIAVGLYGALFVLSLWSTRDDLVECRCRARPGFAASIAGLALFLVLGEATGFLTNDSLEFGLAQSAGTLVIALAISIWLLRPDANQWPGETELLETVRPIASDNGAEPALTGRIRAAMASEIWREEGLTIGVLAGKLNVPEHRLRRAINQGLGYRNFSSFINRSRIEAAAKALIDPTNSHTTVLEIAYDVGFSSIGPFNRAFRAEFGQSPTEYRQTAFAEPGTDSGQLSPIAGNLH